MKIKQIICITLLYILSAGLVHADEGMWVLKELNKQNLDRLKELGFIPSHETLYSDEKPSLSDAVVIFGGGCTGITVSEDGLIFTNHHCGYGAIQQLSSVEHDYLKNGFISQDKASEKPVPGLSVRYLREMTDVSDQINAELATCTTESERLQKADSTGKVISAAVGKSPYTWASVIPFYSDNKYFLIVYDVYRDVRMVFAPPSSMGKFGGDTDNWMWPRHTCDFSVFRVYAGPENKPAEYNAGNQPYHPKYVAEISLQGYRDKDFAMTIGFPGSTNRYLRSWGVQQRMNDTNIPRIEVRGIKQNIWKEAMRASAAVRIKYSSKYASSSNYWKNSIGMNKGLEQLGVIKRKQAEEAAFLQWISENDGRKEKYGEALGLIEKGYTSNNEAVNAYTYLSEALINGAELVRFARTLSGFDKEGSTEEELNIFIEDKVNPFFKDYEPTLDKTVLPEMLKIAQEKVPFKYLPDIYDKKGTLEKKYKGDYAKYVNDLYKNTQLASYDKVIKLIKDPKSTTKVEKDPVVQFSQSILVAVLSLQQEILSSAADISKGERLYFAGLQEMHSNKTFYSDANFSMRASFGSIGGYEPADATWYEYYSTQKGILEKANPNSDEFNVQPEILSLLRTGDFGDYGNNDGTMNICFLTNNDITGGNSGSPIFDKNARVIGLAFDGNWEAMSGDIAFEPALQRCIGVDIRAVLYMIEKWGKCPRLVNELKLVK
ncbi:MAG: S46 family peptidase [Tannerellaceae bacterium]|jgi:hypothetical protein|nr:S46 family peptidase [Tannerellaceae bacterium]